MPKPTLTFPTPQEGAQEFPYEINGERYEIPKFTDVVHSMGVDRRLLDAGLTKDVGARIIIALQVAHQDDPEALRAFDHLTGPQQVELFRKWGEFTGAELGESSGPTNA